MEDQLYIGFDTSNNNSDISTLAVGRQVIQGDTAYMKVLNVITGDRAVELYNELIGKFDI